MKTLFDFITYIKGMEYLLAIGFIGLFLLIWETLKPSPFRQLMALGKDDLRYITGGGARGAMRTAGHTAEAPFLVAAYIAMVPLAFIYGTAVTIGDAIRALHKSS